MDPRERDLADWLDGDADSAGGARLVSAAAADAAARARLIALARIERELGAALGPVDLEARVRGALGSDSGRYATRVMSEVRRQAPSARRRLQRRRSPWLPLALGALAAGLIVAVLLRAPGSTAESSAASPAVPSVVEMPSALAVATAPLRVRRDGVDRELASGGRVLAGDELHTLAASGIRWSDGTTLTIAAGSVLALAADRTGTHLDLRAGGFAAAVTPQPADRPLRLRAPRLRAVVVGTEFELRASAAGSRLGVRSGRVDAQGEDGASATITAGEWAETGPGAALVTGEGGAWSLGHAWAETVTLGVLHRDAAGRAVGATSVASDATHHNQWFAPDQVICIQSDQLGSGGPYLTRLPAGFRLTLRLRAERRGRVAVTFAPAQERADPTDHVGVLDLPIGTTWEDLVLTAERFTAEGGARRLDPGYPLWTLCVFGFDAGRIELTAVAIDPPPAP